MERRVGLAGHRRGRGLPRWFGTRNAAGRMHGPSFGSVITTILTMMSYTKTGIATYNFAAK